MVRESTGADYYRLLRERCGGQMFRTVDIPYCPGDKLRVLTPIWAGFTWQ